MAQVIYGEEDDNLDDCQPDFSDDDCTVIEIKAGMMPAIVDKAEDALVQASIGVYQRDARLVRIGEFPIHNQRPGLGFVEIAKATMIELLTGIVQWVKYDARKDDIKAINCPVDVAETLLARVGYWKLPVIRAIITAPTLRPDGSLLEVSGYDKETGVYYTSQGVRFEKVPDEPTKQDALDCLGLIKDLVAEVPFVKDETHGEINRSVYLAAFLTGLIRTALPTAPLFVFDSPTAGSGKSVLTDSVAATMTGYPAASMTLGFDPEETEKRLATALRCGDAVISFDNCTTPIEGDLFCQAVSQPTLQLRILGRSERCKIENTALYMANGNNLIVMGDMTRRTLRCTIDPDCERPELRTFKTMRPDLTVLAKRADYVWAGLTVLRAFFVAGRPSTTSRTIRDALIWLGEPDPCLTQEQIRMDDPQRDQDAMALRAWHEKFGDERCTAAEVVEIAKQRSEGSHLSQPKFINPGLRDALNSVTDNRLDPHAVGAWLRRVKDRHVQGYIANQASQKNHINAWRVKSMLEQTEPASKAIFR